MVKACERREGPIHCERWLNGSEIRDEVFTPAGPLLSPGRKNLSSFTITQLDYLVRGLQVYIRFREKLAD